MSCLGSVLYDPASVATKATTAALAMTALDTTNARITFTVPSNGIVLVRIRVAQKGATTSPTVLLGVLEGATVKGRQSAAMGRTPGSNGLASHESCFLVTGLTPGAQLTWDAAYGVETLFAATQLGWGGPNNATASDAYGALSFEVWSTETLLAGTNYDPSSAVAKATSALLAMTALDTTNLRLVFTPSTTRVLVKLRTVVSGSASTGLGLQLGVLESATVKGRQAPMGGFTQAGTIAATDHICFESLLVVGGLTPGTSLTWDAAYGVETVIAATNLQYGGPNNTTANDAWGGFAYEIWAV